MDITRTGLLEKCMADNQAMADRVAVSAGARYRALVTELRETIVQLEAASLLTGMSKGRPIEVELPAFALCDHPDRIKVTIGLTEIYRAMCGLLEPSPSRPAGSSATVLPFARA